ncbi:MAG: HutD/Ves family protein [Polaromonas sp.]
MTLQRFALADLPATPWKNGGGSTREIACWPPGAGLDDFGWRVSIATIAAAGPFSVFEGVDRSIMLLDGDGVRLRSGDGRIDHLLDRPHRPFAFSGDAAIACTLLGGPSSDFNVMARRGRWRAELRVLDRAASIAAAAHGVLLALRGSWRLEDHSTLHGDEGLCWTDAPHAWQVEPETPDAQLAAVRFTRAEI